MDQFNLYLGTLGMIFLLTAFSLNLFKVLSEDSRIYIILNVFGAGISAYYAFTLNAMPFIILEGVWCMFAVYKLTKVAMK